MLIIGMDEIWEPLGQIIDQHLIWIFSIWIQVPSTITLRSQLKTSQLQGSGFYSQFFSTPRLGCWVAGWWAKQCTEEMMWSTISLLTFYQSFKKESSKHRLLSAFECFGTSRVQIWYLESTRILILPNSKRYVKVFVWWRFVHRSSWNIIEHHRTS